MTMAMVGTWYTLQDPPHTGQYLAQAEELGHPGSPSAALIRGLALLGLGQRHLAPKVPDQQLGEEHRRAGP